MDKIDQLYRDYLIFMQIAVTGFGFAAVLGDINELANTFAVLGVASVGACLGMLVIAGYLKITRTDKSEEE